MQATGLKVHVIPLPYETCWGPRLRGAGHKKRNATQHNTQFHLWIQKQLALQHATTGKWCKGKCKVGSPMYKRVWAEWVRTLRQREVTNGELSRRGLVSVRPVVVQHTALQNEVPPAPPATESTITPCSQGQQSSSRRWTGESREWRIHATADTTTPLPLLVQC